jgi:hypothetical protein
MKLVIIVTKCKTLYLCINMVMHVRTHHNNYIIILNLVNNFNIYLII